LSEWLGACEVGQSWAERFEYGDLSVMASTEMDGFCHAGGEILVIDRASKMLWAGAGADLAGAVGIDLGARGGGRCVSRTSPESTWRLPLGWPPCCGQAPDRILALSRQRFLSGQRFL